MSVKRKKRLFCCLLAALLALCSFPLRSMAAAQAKTAAFSTFEELRELCGGAAAVSGASLTCEAADLVIAEDLVIPGGVSVTFRSFTVPEGVTLSVLRGAELMAYGLTVQGELVNRGTVFQGDLSGDGEEQDTDILALVPGHIENKGEMTLTDVYGTRNVVTHGGHYTRIETDLYDARLKPQTEDPEPTASPEPRPTPTPTPEDRPWWEFSDEWRENALEVLEKLEVIIPRLAYIFMLVVLGRIVISIIVAKSGKNAGSATTAPSGETARGRYVPSAPEDHFQRDKNTRISQLDDWLKSGLIDRKEYNELKKRYKEE